MAPLTSENLHKTTVKFSMSRAWRLGNAVKIAQKEKRSPVKAILLSQGGKLLISGKIVDVERKTDGGFNKGSVQVEGLGEFTGSTVLVSFQNENLVAERTIADKKKEILATTPDLISIVDSETGEAIPTEEVRYGLRVSAIVLPCSPLLSTERALQVVGPQAFGYKEYRYRACGGYKECDPIPLPKS